MKTRPLAWLIYYLGILDVLLAGLVGDHAIQKFCPTNYPVQLLLLFVFAVASLVSIVSLPYLFLLTNKSPNLPKFKDYLVGFLKVNAN